MSREDRAAEVARLKTEGLNGVQIAQRMGIARSYAYELLSDPEGLKVRARKDSYRGTCIDCGGLTDGSNGAGNAPERCYDCWGIEVRRAARKRIVRELQRFASKYGGPPAAHDWSPLMCAATCSDGHAKVVAERYERDGWPPTSQAVAVFGSWNNAIAAAGFVPRAPGRRGPAWEPEQEAA